MVKDEGRIVNKVIRSTLWVTGSYIFSNILYSLRTIVLIRLLNPIDFGLMGIARVVIDMLTRFSETGVEKAFVQRKEVNRSTLNTVWIIAAIRGVVLFGLLYIFSSAISHFYNNVHLASILKFISLSFLFVGLTSAGVFIFVKELDFKNKVFFEQASAISTTVISVILAIVLRNVWALVIGYVVGTIVGLLFSYTLHPFRPSLKFNLNEAKGLLSFGKYVFASGIVIFLAMNGPDALVGKILGLDSLGFYAIAFGIANTPTTSITHLVSDIVFPAYSKLRDDMPTLREGYLKVTRLVAVISAPLAAGIVLLIPEFTQIFLGARWMPIIVPTRILCILGFFRSIYSTVSPIFFATGRPDIQLKVTSLNLVVLAAIIYPLTVKMGIVGTAIAFSLMSTICLFIMTSLVYRLIQLSAEKIKFFKVLFFPLVGTVFMSLTILLIKIVFPYNLIIVFSMSVLIGALSYIFILYLLDRYFGYGLIETIQFAIVSFKNR